ncbi:MAG: acetolactate synthase small subunit [Gemmatimonadetes bacterium]|nr:MAG: acetolactate synthase small subunit [Gemmatimonadota bacterium]
MRHTLVALMEDRPAALNRVLGLLRGRALAVHSIAFGESETAGVRRITVVVETTDVQQTIKQLNRLIEVLEVTDVTNAEYVVRETALVKIHAPEQQREEIRTIAEGFGAKIVGSSPQTVVVEMTDTPDRLGEMIERAKGLGTCETMRSGSLAMALGTTASRTEVPVREDVARPWWQADGAC